MISRIVLFLVLFCQVWLGHAQFTNIDSLKKALNLVENETKRLEVQIQMAEFYKRNPSLEGLREVETAITRAKKLNDKLSEGALLNFKSQIYEGLYPNDVNGAIQLIDEAFKLLDIYSPTHENDLKAQKLLVSLFNNKAYHFWRWGKLYESLILFDSATKYADRVWKVDTTDHKFIRLHGLQHNSKGAVLWGLGEYDEAFKNYMLAFALFERVGLKENMSLTASNIGLIYDSWGDKEESLQYFKMGVALGNESQSAAAVGYGYSNLGQFMETSGVYDSAEYYYNLSFKKYKEVNDLGGMGLNLNRLGSLYILLERFDEAISLYRENLVVSMRNGSLYWLAVSHLNMAKIWTEKGEWQKALEAANLSLEISKTNGYKEIEKDNYQTLSKFYLKKKDYKNAYEQHLNYSSLKDSLYSDEKYKQITQIKDRYRNARKEAENELLKKDKLIQEQSLHRANIHKLALSLFLVIMMAFVVYFIISKRRIKNANAALEARNQEIMLQREESKQQAEELRKTNEVKNLMFSVVSHDLRSPIRNLESMLLLLNSGDISESDFKTRLPTLTKNVSYLSSLTENLLFWAKSQIGGVNISKGYFDLSKIVQEKMALYAKLAQDKEIDIQFDVQVSTIAYADPYMVEVVMRNLISNAIKFCSSGQMVIVSAKAERDYLTVKVQDNGVGIPPENLAKLFNKIEVSTIGTKNEKGIGIGLMICKYFVEINGGKIWVESVYGEGSTFYFTLPVNANAMA